MNAAYRVYQYDAKPASEAILATLRVALDDAGEERLAPRVIILHAEVADPRATLERLTSLLNRLHPLWPEHVAVQRLAEAPATG